MQQGAYFYAFLKFNLTGLVVHRSLYEGDFIAVWILWAVHALFPHLLRQLILGRFNIVAFGKKARLLSQREEHSHTTLDAFLFQMLHQLTPDTSAF